MWCVVRPRLVIKGAWGQHCCWSTYLIQLQMCITYYQHLGDFDDESSHSLNNRRTNQIEVRSKGSIAFYHWLSPEHSWGIFVSTQARAGAIVLYCNSLEGGAVAQLTQLTPAGWACRGGQGVSEGTLLLFGPTQGDAGGPWWAEYQHDLCPDQSYLLLLLIFCQSPA